MDFFTCSFPVSFWIIACYSWKWTINPMWLSETNEIICSVVFEIVKYKLIIILFRGDFFKTKQILLKLFESNHFVQVNKCVINKLNWPVLEPLTFRKKKIFCEQKFHMVTLNTSWSVFWERLWCCNIRLYQFAFGRRF